MNCIILKQLHSFFMRIIFWAESLMLILWTLRSESRDSYLVRITNNYYQDYYYYNDY